MLAATLVTLIYSVYFWEYGHRDPASNPEYWVLVKVRARPPLCIPTTERCSRWLCCIETSLKALAATSSRWFRGSYSIVSVL